MEEDIKYFEELDKTKIYYDNPPFANKLNIGGLIENLIKGYKDKEESEKYLYDAYQDAGKKMFEYAEKLEKLESRINDKIEKLKSTNTEDNLIEAIRNCEVVLLTELMEEK